MPRDRLDRERSLASSSSSIPFGNAGEGTGMAAKRKQWAMREETQMKEEMRAIWLDKVGLVRQGQCIICEVT